MDLRKKEIEENKINNKKLKNLQRAIHRLLFGRYYKKGGLR